jgi:hypothetical protein
MRRSEVRDPRGLGKLREATERESSTAAVDDAQLNDRSGERYEAIPEQEAVRLAGLA